MLTYRTDDGRRRRPARYPSPSQLWKQLNAEQKRQAADAFWHDEHAANEQAEAVNLIAQRIKFRLKSVIAMPVEKKTQYLLSMPRSPKCSRRGCSWRTTFNINER
jgi:hypothetical protein